MLAYTHREREKINEVNLIASCVLGHPKCSRHPKTTCRYPTLRSRADLMFLHKTHSRYVQVLCSE